jgi:dihydroneopterin aldolase
MTTSRLFLTGIEASGRHGARPGEQDEPQPFVIDLDLELEVSADTIETTADYRGITEAVRSVIEGERFDLIETMAAVLAERVLTIPHVTAATAVVHKPNAARRLGIAGVAAAASAGTLRDG